MFELHEGFSSSPTFSNDEFDWTAFNIYLKNSCYVTTAPTNGTDDIIETDFRKIFHKYQYDDRVTFAYCISADLHNSKGLSAGVATVFKKQFGKSKKQDCTTDHLSYLKVHNGASQWSDFKTLKKQNLRDVILHLKSSQMILKWESYNISTDNLSLGCIRDGISVKHFVSRIVKFQIATQSFVHIIVFNGKYDQELKNGLSYSIIS